MASFSNITGKVPTLLTSIVAIGRISMGVEALTVDAG